MPHSLLCWRGHSQFYGRASLLTNTSDRALCKTITCGSLTQALYSSCFLYCGCIELLVEEQSLEDVSGCRGLTGCSLLSFEDDQHIWRW